MGFIIRHQANKMFASNRQFMKKISNKSLCLVRFLRERSDTTEHDLKKHCVDKTEKKEAFKYLKLYADQGDAEAQLDVGNCYAEGRGIKQSYKDAFKYYKLSANQGNADAQFCVGQCWAEGKGTEQSQKEAFKYYKLSADQGNVDAQFRAGRYCAEGIGMKKDIEQAFKYLKLFLES